MGKDNRPYWEYRGEGVGMEVNRVYGGRYFTKERFLFYERLPSTQDRARELIKAGVCKEGYVIIADEQYKGRGRFRRVWSSSPGRSLTFSLIVVKLPILSMRTALAVVETLDEESGLVAEIKWPNDILVNRKKICGILIEMVGNLGIVGVGINVNETVPLFLNATSVRIETGSPANREAILSSFIRRFEYNLTKDVSEIICSLRKHLSFMNRYTEIETKNRTIRGEFIDLGEDGEIIIRTDSGTITSLLPGEALHVRTLPALNAN